MEKLVEYVEAWTKAQKEFMERWVQSQKEFTENWVVATKLIQDSLISMARPPEGAGREILDLYQSALMAMVDSSKVLTDEAGKIQYMWKENVDRQMDLSRELVENYTNLFNKAA